MEQGHTRHKIYHIQEHLFFSARLFKLRSPTLFSEIKETQFEQRKSCHQQSWHVNADEWFEKLVKAAA
jgi:hypothetical protein